MLPKRLIAEPEIRDVPRTSHTLAYFRCDDGKEYTGAQLGELLGIGPTAVYQRVRRWGWEDKRCLKPGPSKPGRVKSVVRPTKEWLSMGNTPRDVNLPEPTEIENRLFPDRKPKDERLYAVMSSFDKPGASTYQPAIKVHL